MKKILGLGLMLAVWLGQSAGAVTLPAGVKLAAKQEINLGNGDEPKTLDVQKCNETGCIAIVSQLCEGLVRSDAQGAVHPAAAESWDVSPDGKTYTFHLRAGLKWSDGTPLTAQDFEYGLKRLVAPQTASENATIVESVVNALDVNLGKKDVSTLGVKALNATTLKIALVHADSSFLEVLSTISGSPANQKNIEKFGENNFTKPGNLVSNGPFLLTYWQVGDKIVLQKNSNYWNSQNVFLQQASFFPVVDANTEFKMYEAGQLDTTLLMNADHFKSIREKYGNSELHVDPQLASYYYIFNIQKPPFKDNVKLRQALSMAVDRQAVTNAILGMGQKPIYDQVPFGIKNYQANEYAWANLPKPERIEQAKKLFKEAGYDETKPLKLSLTYNTNENHRKIAVAVASMWKQALNVQTVVQNEEWKTMLDKRSQGDFEIMRMGGVAAYNDAYNFLQANRSFDVANVAKYNNKKYDDLMAQAIVQTNANERQRLMQEAGKIFMDDYPIIPVYSYMFPYLVKPYLKEFQRNAMQVYNLVGVYLVEH